MDPLVKEVVDVSGRVVHTLRMGEWRRTAASCSWDLRDARGRPVPRGVYFVRFAGGGGQRLAGARLVVLKADPRSPAAHLRRHRLPMLFVRMQGATSSAGRPGAPTV